MQTRHRHPPFSRPIAVSSNVPLRNRSRGRRIIASSIAHTQSSASDPTISARKGKGVEVGMGVGVEPPPASGTCALSPSLLKGGCVHAEEGAMLFCGLLFPSGNRLWLCGGRRAAVAGRGRRSELLRCWCACPKSWLLHLLIEHAHRLRRQSRCSSYWGDVGCGQSVMLT